MNDKKRIVGVASSANPISMSKKMTEYVLEGAKEAGAETILFDLRKIKLNYCTGCLKCLENGICHLNDEFESIKTLLYEADGIVLSSPTYCGTYNAVYKNFIDRLGLYEYLTSNLGGKYFVGISSAGSRGMAKKTAKEMVKIVTNGTFKRGYISSVLGVPSVRAVQDSEKKNRWKEEANHIGHKLVKDINQKKAFAFQNISGRLVAKLILAPMFKKYIIRDRDHDKKAVYVNLVNRSLI